MSFAKAKVKRFNECDVFVPPVGSYDPKLQDTSISASFLRSDRFNSDQNLSTVSANSLESIQTNSAFKMPQRTKSFSSALSDNGKIKECENEIRRLLSERSKFLKNLTSKEVELEKLYSKHQSMIREKTSLKASLVTLEKENKDARRMNDLLKAKVSVYDKVEKKKDVSGDVIAITEKLVRKEHEIEDLRLELLDVRRELEEMNIAFKEKDSELDTLKSEMNGAVLDVESESEAAKAKLSGLEETNEILKQSTEEVQEQLTEVLEKLSASEGAFVKMKEERMNLANELALCQKELEDKEVEASKVSDELRRENLVLLDRVEEQTSKRQFQEKILSVELDNAHQKLASTENCSRALQDYKDALVGRVSSLKDSVAELENQQTFDMQTIKSLKVEVANLSSELSDKKKALHVSNAEMTALKEQINELQNIHLDGIEKIAALETELGDSKLHAETLEGELLVTRLALQVAEGDIMEFRKCFSETKVELDSKKEEVFKHQTLLEEAKIELAAKEQDLMDSTNRMKDEITSKEVQISELTLEFNNELEKLRSNMETMNEEITLKESEFKDRLEQLLLDITTKQFDIEELTKRLEEQNEKYETYLEKLNEEAACKETDFNKQVELLTDDIKAKDAEVVTLSLKLDSYLVATDSLKLNLEDARKELVGMKEELVANDDQISVITKKITDVQREKCNIKESLVSLQTAFEDQQRDVAMEMDIVICAFSNLKVAADIKEGEFVALKVAKEQLEREIEHKADKEKRIVEENAELSSSLASKALRIDELERLVLALKEQTQTLMDDFMLKEGDFESNIRNLEAKLMSKETELVAALLKLQESHASAENSISTLRNSLTRMEAEKHDKEMLYLEMKNMRNILHDELRQTQRELTETETKLESSEVTNNNLLEKVESLKTANTIGEEKLKASSERVLELEKEVMTNGKEILNLKGKHERKCSEVDVLNAEIQNLMKSIHENDTEISQLKMIIEQNQQLAKDKSLVEDLTTTMDELNRLLETSKEQSALIIEMNEERNKFEETIQQQRQEIQLHTATIEWYSDREKEILREFDLVEAKAKEDEKETKRILSETQKAFSMLEEKFQSYRERKENEGKQNEAMVQALTNDYEAKLKQVSTDANEKFYWRKMYEDLAAKVEPFMEQLDAYEVERNELRSQNQETTSSLAKLSDQYAKLLGHQNHRQKIHYMTNLKEEVLKLREENAKLRIDVLKYQKVTQRRDVPGSAARSVRPADSAKRFHNPNKENNGTPLRDRNYI